MEGKLKTTGNMWCFIDETWPTRKSGSQHVMCLGITLVDDERLLDLERHLYRVRVKYYGQDHARDQRRELKGNQLFSNATFKLRAQGKSPINHSVAREILNGCLDDASRPWVQCMGVLIYGDKKPDLSIANLKKLDFPIQRLLEKISSAAAQRHHRALLIFDQMPNKQDDLAAAIYKYVAGKGVQNVHSVPLFGSSHVTPGIQVADIVAYILSRKAMGDDRMEIWFGLARKLQWQGEVNGKVAYGFERYDKKGEDYVIRRRW